MEIQPLHKTHVDGIMDDTDQPLDYLKFAQDLCDFVDHSDFEFPHDQNADGSPAIPAIQLQQNEKKTPANALSHQSSEHLTFQNVLNLESNLSPDDLDSLIANHCSSASPPKPCSSSAPTHQISSTSSSHLESTTSTSSSLNEPLQKTPCEVSGQKVGVCTTMSVTEWSSDDNDGASESASSPDQIESKDIQPQVDSAQYFLQDKVPVVPEPSAAAVKRRGRKRKNLDPATVLAITKQRNKNHAKTTRFKEKLHVDCLKDEVGDLLTKQQMLEKGKYESMPSQQVDQVRLMKTQLMSFLLYFSNGIIDRSCWSETLDEGFVMMKTLAPFYHVANGTVMSNKKRISGIDAFLKEINGLSSFVNEVTKRCSQLKSDIPPGLKVNISFKCEKTDIICDGKQAACLMDITTENLVLCGFPREVTSSASVMCKFTKQGKMRHMELIYDAMGFSSQLIGYNILKKDFMDRCNALNSNTWAGTMPYMPLHQQLPVFAGGASMMTQSPFHPGIQASTSKRGRHLHKPQKMKDRMVAPSPILPIPQIPKMMVPSPFSFPMMMPTFGFAPMR